VSKPTSFGLIRSLPKQFPQGASTGSQVCYCFVSRRSFLLLRTLTQAIQFSSLVQLNSLTNIILLCIEYLITYVTTIDTTNNVGTSSIKKIGIGIYISC
jgi:hypothetical protein